MNCVRNIQSISELSLESGVKFQTGDKVTNEVGVKIFFVLVNISCGLVM